MRGFSLCIAGLLAVISCDEHSDFCRPQAVNLVESIATRGSKGDGRVYRVYLNGLEGHETQGIETSGTYVDNMSGGPLSPCTVTAGNEFDEIDSSCGLRSIDGYYKMHIVHPPVTMERIPDNRSQGRGINGYLIERENTDQEKELFISRSADVYLSGVYLSDDSGLQYVFDASDMLLRQQRSRVSVRFICGSDIESTKLRSVSFRNIIRQGYYRPADGRFYILSDGSPDDDVEDVNLFNGELVLDSGESVELEETHILSMNYGETDNQGNSLWPLPSLVFTTGEDEGNPVTFTVALGWLFEPQKEYVFYITMNSMHVNIELGVAPWDEKDIDSENITYLASWSVGIAVSDWDKEETEGTI